MQYASIKATQCQNITTYIQHNVTMLNIIYSQTACMTASSSRLHVVNTSN